MAINKNFIIKNGLEVSQDVLYVDPSTEKVGIGLTAPSAKLTVSGDAYVTGLGTITTLNSTTATIGQVEISSGVVTASSYDGDGSTLSGIVTSITAGDFISVSASTGNVTITGLANTSNVNADSLVVTGVSTLGVVTGATYYGDGSNLSGLISGVGVATAGGLVGSGATILDFRGTGISTVTVSSGIATIIITGGGGGGGTDPSYNSINVSGIATIGTVEISSGIITSTSGIVTYYGDGSNLTGSSPDFIAGSGISSDSTYVGTGITLFNFIGGSNIDVDATKSGTTANVTLNTSESIVITQLNVTGVASCGFITETSSIGCTDLYVNKILGSGGGDIDSFVNISADNFYGDASNVTGIVTFVDAGTNINVNGTTGTVTVNLNDIPNLLGINLTSGIATVPTLSATNGTITTLNSTSGTITNLSGTAGTITTLNSTTGTITNLNSSRATITNLSGTISTINTIDVGNALVQQISGNIGTFTSLDVQSNLDVYASQAVLHNDLYVVGNLSIGGTASSLNAVDLRISDKDIVLGVTTDSNGEDISTDDTANHGGIAVASTEGSPLVPLQVTGINTLPNTYKQFMWVKGGTYGVGTTDAWMSNYAVGVGSTQVPNGVVFAAGSVQFTDNTINTPQLVVSGIATAQSLDVNTNLTSTNINASGVVTAANGFNIGIQSEGTDVTTGPITTINFVGTGNTFDVNGTTVDISIFGAKFSPVNFILN